MLGGFEKALLAVLVLVLMTGMGATLTWEQLRGVLRRPRGVLVGLASQFGWMPLIAWGLVSVLNLPAAMAVGLIIVGCTPGGTTSNLFTYYARADLALSIAMTTVSTLVAVLVMPAVLWLYASGFTDASLQIPYGNIAQTLVVVLVPVALGMGIRRRSQALAAKVERAGSLAGIAVLLLLIGSGLADNAGILATFTPAMWLAPLALGALGIGLGYLAAGAAGLGVSQRRAVALETGIQNSPLAFAIIIGSFPEALHDELLWLPMLYALLVLVNASLATLWWRRGDDGPVTAEARA